MLKTLSRYKNILLVIAVAIYEAVLLVTMQGEMLRLAQDLSEWSSDSSFFWTSLHQSFGIVGWVSSFLTQLFYYPWFGVLIMFSMWIASLFLFIYGLRLKPSMYWLPLLPIICQQVLLTHAGYWMYTMSLGSYWFLGTVVLLLIAVCTAVLRLLSVVAVKWLRMLLRIAVVACFALLICPKGSVGLFQGGGLMMMLPFAMMLITLILMFVVSAFVNPSRKSFSWVGVVVTVLFISWASMMNYHASCFQNEIRMARAVEEGRLDDVVSLANNAGGRKTRLMLLLRDGADLILNHSSDSVLLEVNDGIKPMMITDPPIHMAQIGGDVLYYIFGLTNYSYKWSYENGVKYGFSPRRLRMLLRCAILNGEYGVARRYASLLSKTLFHSAFASRMMSLLDHPERIASYPEFAPYINNRCWLDVLASDNGHPEKFLIQYLPNTKNVKWQSDSQQYLTY
ncbi:MAG: hypothetical protein IKR18_03060 [Bacteroidaceae bacterium]|nr:hypothetical protein [Bacteroidaceae bacterium]